MPVARDGRTSMCELTEAAMQALTRVADTLDALDYRDLSPIELRTLMWSRCSLAALYGIRADEAMGDISALDLESLLID